MSKKPQRPVCTECGSSDIKADAWATWSDEKQEWVLDQTFESTAICEDCGGECSLDWDDIEEPDGTDGQDRESYSDDQDRDSYSA